MLVTVATSQRLFDDIRLRSAPFFGQFQVEYLTPLKLDEAVELLWRISLYHEDQGLASFLLTNRGRSRVKAVYHLSGGNHRVFIILSEFISREALDELVMAFDKLRDELTPYYQQRIDWLPPQQRKLVEYLCRSESPVPVKDMSRRLFMTQQTASRQLKELRDKGYVISHRRGRESLYELAEPLMRLCVEVKEGRRQPVRLVVRFLRVWYTDDELWRFEKSSVGASYIEAVLSGKAVSNTTDAAPKLGAQDVKPMMLRASKIAQKHFVSNDYKTAIDELSNLINLATDKAEICMSLLIRGIAYGQLGNLERAISDYTLILEMPDTPVDYKTTALINRGYMYSQLGDSEQAISHYTLVVEMSDVPVKLKAIALVNRGYMYGQLGDSEQAILDYTLVVEMADAPVELKAKALYDRGGSYGHLGDIEQAISDCTSVIEMPDAPVDEKAKALVSRALFRSKQDKYLGAIADVDEATRLSPNDSFARLLRVEILMHLESWDEAFDYLKHTLTSFPPSITGKAGNTLAMIHIISQQASSKWRHFVPKIVEIYRDADALEFLGKGLVISLGRLELPAELLVSWEQTWRNAISNVATLRVPLRAFAAGIRCLQSVDQDGGDGHSLGDLLIEEAIILRHALSIESPDN